MTDLTLDKINISTVSKMEQNELENLWANRFKQNLLYTIIKGDDKREIVTKKRSFKTKIGVGRGNLPQNW